MEAKTILIVAAVAAVLLLVMAVYLWVTVRQIVNRPAAQAPLGPLSSQVSLNSSAVLPYNNSYNFAVYALLSYNIRNATNATVTLGAYTKNPVEGIYLLNVSAYCVSCFNETSLTGALTSDLNSYGLIRAGGFQFVNLANASSIPRNSIVIIPSGILPLSLVNTTAGSIFRMLDNGDTVVYAGTDFSKELGSYKVVSYASPSLIKQFTLYNLSTSGPASGQNAANNGNLSFRNPAFSFSYGSYYGNVTYVNSRNGTVIAFSNYPNVGWSNASSMAGDIARLINSRFWIPNIGQSASRFSTGASASGNFGIIANVTRPSPSSPVTPMAEVNSSYSLVTVVARNQSGSAATEFSFKNRYNWNGTVNAPKKTGEGQAVSVAVSPNNVIGENSNIRLQLEVFDTNMSHIEFISMGTGTFSPGTFYGVTPSFSMPNGYYILALEGYGGYKYAESFFYLTNATITPTSYDFKNGTFIFSLYSNGLPVSSATYTISMDDAYLDKGTVSNGTIEYQLPRGTTIPYGTHYFKIDIFGNSYTTAEQYVQTIAHIPEIYIEFAIAIVVVVLLNLILKPPSRDDYYIDVPQFPPIKKDKAGVPAASVLGVFDKVNYYYHWKYMPLNVEEVRLGINGNIRINNMPVSVTTQNADAVLAKLTAKGDLVSTLSYYAPKAWVDVSKHDIEYLLIFRKLRDYCVIHSVLFTDIDMEQGVDMIITKGGKQGNLFIYSTGSKPKSVILSTESRSFLVFIDETKKQEFVNGLFESFGEEAETLKLGIEYNYLVLIDCDHLDQITL
jgi:hypothetical protein